MTAKLSMRDEHKRVIGVLHGLALDLEYQQTTLHDLKLSLPDGITEQDSIMQAFFGVRVHLQDSERWLNVLLDDIRLAQDDQLQALLEIGRRRYKA